jgi:hypothetical protein
MRDGEIPLGFNRSNLIVSTDRVYIYGSSSGLVVVNQADAKLWSLEDQNHLELELVDGRRFQVPCTVAMAALVSLPFSRDFAA